MHLRTGTPAVLEHWLITNNQLTKRIKLVTEQKQWERRGPACSPQGAPFLMVETRDIQKAKWKLRLASGPETRPSSWEEAGQTDRARTPAIKAWRGPGCTREHS